MKITPHFRPIILCAGVLLCPSPWPAASDDITEWMAGQLDEWEVDVTALPIQAPTPDEWRQFWTVIQQALGSDTLDELAALQPYADMAMSFVEKQPDGAPYAAWLRQRLDYCWMAGNVMSSLTPKPPPPAVKPPPTAPTTRPARPAMRPAPRKILPPAGIPSVKTAPTPTATRRAGDINAWRARLAQRPTPANAQKYVAALKKIFRDEKVPEQLIWLAEVESSFVPEARSPVGAAGLFQFMPATAERFGLALRPDDERLHPEKSARAAAQYLRILHKQFESWPLALAAYNAGEGRVRGLLRKHQAASFDDIAGRLPAETRMYVPKIRAVVMLRENADIEKL